MWRARANLLPYFAAAFLGACNGTTAATASDSFAKEACKVVAHSSANVWVVRPDGGDARTLKVVPKAQPISTYDIDNAHFYASGRSLYENVVPVASTTDTGLASGNLRVPIFNSLCQHPSPVLADHLRNLLITTPAIPGDGQRAPIPSKEAFEYCNAKGGSCYGSLWKRIIPDFVVIVLPPAEGGSESGGLSFLNFLVGRAEAAESDPVAFADKPDAQYSFELDGDSKFYPMIDDPRGGSHSPSQIPINQDGKVLFVAKGGMLGCVYPADKSSQDFPMSFDKDGNAGLWTCRLVPGKLKEVFQRAQN
jgi:hypothetical protein